ncbi:MAG TPA: EscU/YscU/HrcU family type III secretion system export apparatus switch protein [Acidimicrobiales bacterium]|nr:EscU/YscU/HrcU family type III secretion system export apparatus switch protein [Acidimicrobiales bacterium]
MSQRDAERTEKPTPKRKKEARRKGQVAKSPDVSGWLVVLVASMVVPALVHAGETRMVGLWNQAGDVMADPSSAGALAVMGAGFTDMFALVLPTVGIMAVVGVLANVAQVGFAFSTQAAKPQFSRINPVSGFKRLFSSSSAWELLKQLLKLGALVGLAYQAVTHLARQTVMSGAIGLGPVLGVVGPSILGLVRATAAIGLVLAVADWGFKKHKLNKTLKMSKHEIKEEAKQQEGDPVIKRAVRRKMLTMSRMRMMAAIAGADVVVTNPTHYAVALRYEPGASMAPRVVAKGADAVAARIREEAKRCNVPIVEDPPLARAIYGSCELDAQIPRELFVAVARLLAFVFTLPPVVRRSGATHRRPASALVA